MSTLPQCTIRVVSYPAGGDVTTIPESFLLDEVCPNSELDIQICWFDPLLNKLYFLFYTAGAYPGQTPNIVTAYLRDEHGAYLKDLLGRRLTSISFEAVLFRYVTTNGGADQLISPLGENLFAIL